MTTTGASGRRSTWPATASATGSTGTSTTRFLGSWQSCAPPSGRTSCQSHESGRSGSAGPTCGPTRSSEWLEQCHRAGQERPTPLLLRYGTGGWNALHRDLYGDLVFPLQVVVGLDEPGADYSGGEFVVVENRMRAQSRATTALIGQGDALVFTTRDRPVRSARGWSAASLRHGVSVLRSGRRTTLGLIFHDAA